MGAVLALLAALPGRAAGHWIEPDAIVAHLNAEQTRQEWGVSGVVRDGKAPRLLVIRVGEAWYAHPPAARADRAREWYELWHHAVEGGIVAVLDARTERPVVRFGHEGRVLEVAPSPASKVSDAAGR